MVVEIPGFQKYSSTVDAAVDSVPTNVVLQPGPANGPSRDPTAAELFRASSVSELQQNLSDIYHDYDSSELSEDARATLARNAEWLKLPYNTAVILVEGHADSRGTNEYNLVLGERVARAAMEYLQALGVPASRLKYVSYGEEFPQCTEENESCWQRNRRVHFRIDAK